MGCCAAVLARRGRFAVLGRPAVRAIIGAAMAGLYLAWPIGQSNVLGTTAMAFGTALLLLGGATASRAHARPLRALAACGRLSYEIYLFHLVVLGLIRGWAPPALASGDARVALLAVYLAASCAAGWLVARWWSEPANAALRLHTRA